MSAVERYASRLVWAGGVVLRSPADFRSSHEAWQWYELALPLCDHPDCTVRRSALLVGGRAAVWLQNHRTARELLKQLLITDPGPDSSPSRWFISAWLALSIRDPLPDFQAGEDGTSQAIVALQTLTPNVPLEVVEQTISLILRALPNPDVIEREVIRELLERPIRERHSWGGERWQQAAQIYRRIATRKWAPACSALTVYDNDRTWRKLLDFATVTPYSNGSGEDPELFAWVERMLAGTLETNASRENFTPVELDTADLPPWAEWLQLRMELAGQASGISLIRSSNHHSTGHPETTALQRPSPTVSPLAVLAVRYWRELSPELVGDAAWAARIESAANRIAGELADDDLRLWKNLASGNVAEFDSLARSFIARLAIPLGPQLAQVAVAEFELCERIREGRAALRTGDCSRAITLLQSAMDALREGPQFMVRTWKPACTYWLGIAQVPSAPDLAERLWNSLLGGVLTASAAAQLALLALRREDVSAAAELLASSSATLPATLYAKATLAAHRLRFAEATEFLDELEMTDVGKGPWRQAGRRLNAAICDRWGRGNAAERQYRLILADDPDDALTAGRLAHLLWHRFVNSSPSLGAPVLSEITDWLERARPIGWSAPLRQVCEVLQGGLSTTLDPVASPAASSWLMGIQALRELETGRQVEARRVLEMARRRLSETADV